MVKKLTASVKKRSVNLISRLRRTQKLVYYANPKAHIPHDISMPAHSFYEKIEHHLRNEATIVPVIKETLTWKKFIRYNPGFKQLKKEIIKIEGRDYPEKAWDLVARNVVRVVKKYHKMVE